MTLLRMVEIIFDHDKNAGLNEEDCTKHKKLYCRGRFAARSHHGLLVQNELF